MITERGFAMHTHMHLLDRNEVELNVPTRLIHTNTKECKYDGVTCYDLTFTFSIWLGQHEYTVKADRRAPNIKRRKELYIMSSNRDVVDRRVILRATGTFAPNDMPHLAISGVSLTPASLPPEWLSIIE